MQHLHVDSERLGYSVWGKSLQYQYPYKDEDAAQKHGLVLAAMAHLQSKFPHLDFDSLVARIDPSVATFDHECLTPLVGSVTQPGTTPNLQIILEDPMWDPKLRSQAHPDLLPIFADDAEAAAIHEFHRLNNFLETTKGPYHHSLARQNMSALEEAFPYIDFPGFLQKATKTFPEYFDQVLSAAAPSAGLKLIG